jgi:adenylate kinase family enzyme
LSYFSWRTDARRNRIVFFKNRNSEDGKVLDNYVSKGDIVPAELTVKLLINGIKRKNAKKYLIDGFPRGLDIA